MNPAATITDPPTSRGKPPAARPSDQLEVAAERCEALTPNHHPWLRPFTEDEVHRMVELGILDEREHVELLDGRLLQMSPQGPEHSGVVERLTDAFAPLVAQRRAAIRTHSPVRLNDGSQPEPDFTLISRLGPRSKAAHPGPQDVLLVVEVAAGSEPLDRGPKQRNYAAAGIVEYWLIALPRQTLTVYRDPSPAGYETMSTHRPGESLAPLKFPDHAVDLNWLLA